MIIYEMTIIRCMYCLVRNKQLKKKDVGNWSGDWFVYKY